MLHFFAYPVLLIAILILSVRLIHTVRAKDEIMENSIKALERINGALDAMRMDAQTNALAGMDKMNDIKDQLGDILQEIKEDTETIIQKISK